MQTHRHSHSKHRPERRPLIHDEASDLTADNATTQPFTTHDEPVDPTFADQTTAPATASTTLNETAASDPPRPLPRW